MMALAIILFYFCNGCFERFFLIAACGRSHCNCFFFSAICSPSLMIRMIFIYLIYIFPMTTRSIIWVSCLVCAEAKPAAMSIFAHGACLTLADLEHEAAAGAQQTLPIFYNALVEAKPVFSAVERPDRLIVAHGTVKLGDLGALYVRRVRDDNVKAANAERGASLSRPPACR